MPAGPGGGSPAWSRRCDRGGPGGVRTPLPALCPGVPAGQPAAPGRAPASRGPAPPAAGCSKRLGGSRALWGVRGAGGGGLARPGSGSPHRQGWHRGCQTHCRRAAITFWFHSRDSKCHVQVIKETFSTGWGPFFRPLAMSLGLPLALPPSRGCLWSCAPPLAPIPLLLRPATGSSHQWQPCKGKWQFIKPR